MATAAVAMGTLCRDADIFQRIAHILRYTTIYVCISPEGGTKITPLAHGLIGMYLGVTSTIRRLSGPDIPSIIRRSDITPLRECLHGVRPHKNSRHSTPPVILLPHHRSFHNHNRRILSVRMMGVAPCTRFYAAWTTAQNKRAQDTPQHREYCTATRSSRSQKNATPRRM